MRSATSWARSLSTARSGWGRPGPRPAASPNSESLRDLIHELLTELGYEVLAVAQGEEALALIQQGRHSVDLVLMDVVMPKLGGGELVKRLRAIRPRLRVVYMSGYTDGAISRQGVLDKGAVLLEKPFTAQNLGRTIRTALDQRP